MYFFGLARRELQFVLVLLKLLILKTDSFFGTDYYEESESLDRLGCIRLERTEATALFLPVSY